jgi:hypothetical protein
MTEPVATSFARHLLTTSGFAALGVAVLCAVALAERGPFDTSLIIISGSLCGVLGVAALAALRFGTSTHQRRVLWLFWVLVATEGLTQALAAAQLIPGASVRVSTPLGRVYWTKEGGHSGLMNRRGWHSRRRAFSGAARRIVIIGDSFIEALEVSQSDGVGARLEERLPDAQVITLGRGATGPGHYLETLRYALEFLQPDDVIISFFLGNDFTDSLGHEVWGSQLEHELLYGVDRSGRVTLHPSTMITPETYRYRLYYNHYVTPLTVTRTLLSHHLLSGLGQNLWTHRAALLSPPPVFHASDTMPTMRIGEGEPMRLSLALLQQAREEAARAGARFSVATVPNFPEALYLKPPGSVPDLSPYGPLVDERELTEQLRRSGVPALALGERIVTEQRTVADIEALFIDGIGHFTPHGHAWFAQALCTAFYPPCPVQP